MSKLLEHFRRMQTQAAAYIEPTPTYTSLDKRVSPVGSLARKGRDRLFIEDMIYMLDGPEQREAEHDMSELLDELANVQNLRNRVAVLESDHKRALELVKPLEDENNALRSRLMASELAYAKLTGYLDRIEDERPPVMVAQERERFRSQIPDGTMGSDMGGWRGGDSHRDRRWYHR